jgi:hypothetical protein
MKMIEKFYDTNGYYEPNWFHMYISNFKDPDLNFEVCDNSQLGLYIHEYSHYIQNITTVSGVRNAINYFKSIHNLRLKLSQMEVIKLPLPEDILIESMLDQRKKYFKFKGVNNFNNTSGYSRFDTSVIKINLNDKEEEILNISFYDSNGSNPIGNIELGSLCIKEGMARALQKTFDPNVKHPFYPYLISEILIDQYCPSIKDSHYKIAALSNLALNYENSGIHFFRLLNEFNQAHEYLTFKDFIKKELFDKKIEINGKPGNSIKDVLIFSIKELRSVLKVFLNSELKYINDLLDNLELIEKDGVIEFYDILNANNLTNIEKLVELKAIYGIPVVQLFNGTLVFPFANDEIPSELIELMSIKTLTYRLFEIEQNTTCRFYLFCQNGIDDITDHNCHERQWLRKTECPMSQVIKYWDIGHKLLDN